MHVTDKRWSTFVKIVPLIHICVFSVSVKLGRMPKKTEIDYVNTDDTFYGKTSCNNVEPSQSSQRNSVHGSLKLTLMAIAMANRG